MIADADQAMYEAKRNGGAHHILDLRSVEPTPD